MLIYGIISLGGGNMARTYELALSMDYVSDWSIVDAIRELYQNCIDEKEQSGHDWFSTYENGVLTIGNHKSKLNIASLLIGYTSKRGDSKTIGRHGEGYKVASVVLLRNGLTFKIKNYAAKEVWEAHVVKSRRYGGEKVVKFEVSNLGIFNKSLEDSISFEIGGVTEEVYKEVVNSNLWLQGIESSSDKVLSCDDGMVLLDPKYSGHVYVGGLYVKSFHKSNVKYGYNFNPGNIVLDRDRHMLDTWDVKFAASSLVAKLPVEDIEKVMDSPECEYILNYIKGDNSDGKLSYLSESEFNTFISRYGENCVPVADSDTFNRYASAGYSCQMLSPRDYKLVTSSSRYVKKDLQESSWIDLVSRLETLVNSIMVSESKKLALNELVKEMKEKAKKEK